MWSETVQGMGRNFAQAEPCVGRVGVACMPRAWVSTKAACNSDMHDKFSMGCPQTVCYSARPCTPHPPTAQHSMHAHRRHVICGRSSLAVASTEGASQRTLWSVKLASIDIPAGTGGLHAADCRPGVLWSGAALATLPIPSAHVPRTPVATCCC